MNSQHPSATQEEIEQRSDAGIRHSTVKMATSIVYSNPMTGYHFHHHHPRFDLFGGSKPWDKAEWTAQDDRLRGGISISHLTIHPIPGSFSSSPGSPGAIATFNGSLDTKTLGGAGFASQRTVGDDTRWDLSGYDGIEVIVLIPQSNADLIELGDGPAPAPIKERIYTITLKDCIIRGEPDAGKEISWEWNFKPKFGKEELEGAGHHKKGSTMQYFKATWGDFKAFNRGRPVDAGKELDAGKIKRFSIMIRSFFQEQQDGDFSVSLVSISAVGGKKHGHQRDILGEDIAGNTCPLPTAARLKRRGQWYSEAYDAEVDAEVDGEDVVNEKAMRRETHSRADGGGWLNWLCGLW